METLFFRGDNGRRKTAGRDLRGMPGGHDWILRKTDAGLFAQGDKRPEMRRMRLSPID